MGSSYKNIYSCRRIHLLFWLLLVSSSAQMRFMAEGRPIFKLLEASKMVGEEKVFMRSQIGSRPPRCERRCSSCGHCEAVQVPAVPQDRSGRRHFSMFTTISSRGEDSSNYKPMNWKCKCGDMIFNP